MFYQNVIFCRRTLSKLYNRPACFIKTLYSAGIFCRNFTTARRVLSKRYILPAYFAETLQPPGAFYQNVIFCRHILPKLYNRPARFIKTLYSAGIFCRNFTTARRVLSKRYILPAYFAETLQPPGAFYQNVIFCRQSFINNIINRRAIRRSFRVRRRSSDCASIAPIVFRRRRRQIFFQASLSSFRECIFRFHNVRHRQAPCRNGAPNRNRDGRNRP